MSWLSRVSAVSQLVDTHHQMLLRAAAGLTPESSAAMYAWSDDSGVTSAHGYDGATALSTRETDR